MQAYTPLSRPRLPISQFDLFTGGKPAELAIFFNTAQSNLDKLVRHLSKKENFSIDQLPDTTYIALRNYLWKGYWENKNKSGYTLLEDDRRLIIELYRKLSKLRNFHSHIWHDHQANHFNEQLYRFVTDCLEVASAATRQKHPNEVDFFYEQLAKFPHFKKHNGQQYITKEGKVFFLSLFLTRGEMSSLLQQLKGSKRTDMPQFKIKHIIYKHFCHRDGSILLPFHQEESFFQQMSPDERTEILHARQAYKIISYLNDIPTGLYDTECIPLLIRSHEQTLIEATTVQDLLMFIDQQQYFKDWQFEEIDIKKEDKEHAEHLKKNGVVSLQLKAFRQYSFNISAPILRLLLMERIIKGQSYEAVATEKFTSFIQRREKLYGLLLNQYKGHQQYDETSIREILLQYPLQGHSMLQNTFAKWLEAYERKDRSTSQLTINLLNKIRPLGTTGFIARDRTRYNTIPETQPIVPKLNDFFVEEQRKPRKENHFVRFAVQYLIDQKVTDSWFWQVETFGIQEKENKQVLQKKKLFAKNHIPPDHRLTLINNHVLVGIPKNNIDDLVSGDKEQFYQFLIGPKALRYLICYHILKNDSSRPYAGKPLESFFAGGIMKDYKKMLSLIQQGGIENFESLGCTLLEPHHVPALFHKKLTPNTSRQPLGLTAEHKELLSKQLIRRINNITGKLDNQLQTHYRMSRSEKNRLIMQCYTLFTWTPKFLRKGEYNEMSVCHYTLDDREKFNYLFNKKFRFSQRVPPEVLGLLRSSSSLDELLQNTVHEVKNILSILKEQVLTGRFKKDDFKKWFRKLGLSVPDGLVSITEQEEINKYREKNLQFLPFDIHPSLVLKYFYPDRYLNKDFKKSSPLANMRDDRYTTGLFMDHYSIQPLHELYSQFSNSTKAGKQIRSITSGIIYDINTTLAEDAMLWYMAKTYMNNTNIAASAANGIMSALTAGSELHVGNLHRELVTVDAGNPIYLRCNRQQYDMLTWNSKSWILSAALYTEQKQNRRFSSSTDALLFSDITNIVVNRLGTEITGNLCGNDIIVIQPLFTQLRLHQLDDYLFQVNKSRLHYAAMHHINRMKEEGMLAATPEGFEMGTLENPIAFEVLTREISLVNRQGQALCAYLLDWERNVIANYCESNGVIDDAEAKQQLLINDFLTTAHNNTNDSYHLPFPKVCTMAGDLLADHGVSEDTLKEVRNSILHSYIPLTASYNQLALPGSRLGALLNIVSPLASVKDRSFFKTKALYGEDIEK